VNDVPTGLTDSGLKFKPGLDLSSRPKIRVKKMEPNISAGIKSRLGPFEEVFSILHHYMMRVTLANAQIRIEHLQIFATHLLGWNFSPCFHRSFQVTHLEIKHTTFTLF
jgi:hypothetical protein